MACSSSNYAAVYITHNPCLFTDEAMIDQRQTTINQECLRAQQLFTVSKLKCS